MWILISAFLFLGFSSPVAAQQPGTVSDTLLLRIGDTLQLSQTYLVPFSERIILPGKKLPESAYTLNYQQGRLILLDSAYDELEARISYRYFTKTPSEEIAIRKFRIVTDSATLEQNLDVYIAEPYKREDDTFWETSKINKSGSISRGITVGNQQGLSVTSGLRLQLEGDLGDGLKIVGAITDENIPIQPDGTTQQITDFDKIFIRLSKDRFNVTIGDYEVTHGGSRFANFYRNVQGLQAGYNSPDTRIRLSGAVAKGQFNNNSFMGIDGVAGPYRLTGKNGERFFTVLAGSEKVYLNGKLMRRGEVNDYIIDYNTAEITFTSRHVITNITRIVVDFEYTDRNFNRSLMVAQLNQKLLNDRFRLRFSYGRDADNPNAPFDDRTAYNEVRDSLSQIGDDNGLATTSGITITGYSETEPRYARRDTVVNGQPFERYVISRDSSVAVFKIFFSFVGNGNGTYTKDQSGINNNVFVWSPPDSIGNLTGDYAPVRSWALPRLLQVADAQLEYKINKELRLYSETAVSLEDKNRLSNLDDGDNAAIANVAGLAGDNIRLSDSISMGFDVSHQYVQKEYNNLDRVYKAEYGRIWNFDDLGERTDEQIAQAKLKFDYKQKLRMNAEGGIRQAGPGNLAVRQAYTLSSSMSKFLQGDYTFTTISNRNDSTGRLSRWNRHEGDVFFRAWKLKPGLEIWIEDKDEKFADTLSTGSFAFIDLKPYLRTVDLPKFQADFSVNYRFDREFANGLLRDKSKAITHFYRWSLRPSDNFILQNTTSYRTLNVLDTVFEASGLSDSRVINTNLQTTYSSKKRFFYTNFVYEATSEQVARKEVSFIEVNPGQGQYEWIDYNGNKVQEIDEFELSTNPLIANFLRIIRPTQDLFPTTRLSLTGTVRMDFRKLLKKSDNGFKEALRNIRTFTNFRLIQNRERGDKFSDYLIKPGDLFSDTTLLDALFNFRQDVNFFQNNPVGDFSFTWLKNQSRQFLSTGNELKAFSYFQAEQRLNIGKDKSIEAQTRFGNKSALAEQFSTRNFDIRFIEIRPRFNFQFSRKLRFSLAYEYKHKRNFNDSMIVNSTINTHKAIFDARWNIRDRNNILTKLELVSVGQDGSPGFAADYELRDGLQPGFNGIWQVFFTWYIFKNVELSLNYDGRASETNPIIHSGRAQIRAFF